MNLPQEVIPCFSGPKQLELAEIQREVDADLLEDCYDQQELEEDNGYQEFEEDDLDTGLLEHMDILALTDLHNDR